MAQRNPGNAMVDAPYLVVNGEGRIEGLNPAAERLFNRASASLNDACLVPLLTDDQRLLDGIVAMGEGRAHPLPESVAFGTDDPAAPAYGVTASLLTPPNGSESRIALMLSVPAAYPSERDSSLYGEMFERNTAPKLLIEPDSGRIVDANPAALQLYGYTRDELLAQTIQAINTLSASAVQAERERARREHRRYFEFRHRTASGDIRDVKVYTGPMVIDGRTYLHSIIHDVTHERRRERQIRSLVGNFPGGVLFEGTDRRVQLINRAFADLLGIAADPDALTGQDARALAARAQDLFLDPKAFSEGIRACIDARQTVLAQKLACRDGRILERDYVPVDDQQGQALGHLWFYRDVTERERSAERLRQSASVFEHASEGIIITDANGTILDVNAAFTRMTGYRREEAIGNNPRMLQSGIQPREYYQRMWATLRRDGRWSAEVWNRRKDGRLYLAMQTISAIQNERGEVERYVSLSADMTALKEHQDQLERMAHYDPLTGLPNRSLLAERIKQAMTTAEQHGRVLAIAYIDLDGFKSVNDAHGQASGDELLIGVACRMQAALPQGDTLARVGGDEFVAVIVSRDHRQATEPVIQRLLDAVTRPIETNGEYLRSAASIGVTFYPQCDALDADQLVRQADQAMYAAKQAGKNRAAVFDPEHDQAVRGQQEAVQRIRHALARHELTLYYQPKVDMKAGKVVGVEALIRWDCPTRGLLSPAAFLPAIAGTAAAVEVGDWVLEAAASQAQAWREAGMPLPVSVNVDGDQLIRPDFIDKLRACLARHPKLDPRDLELEVLETSALDDIDRVGEVIAACDELGVGFALDDFGTGYSTLTHLKRLPAPLLKIDRTFVQDMLDDPEDMAILDGVQGLADAFRRRTIAEGVETVAHGSMLLALGCQLGQGYGIAHPMPPEDLPDWLTRWQPDPAWRARERVANDDLPALFAIAEHRAWCRRLEAAMSDGSTLPTLDPAACRFGEWLSDQRREGRHDMRSLAAIERIHERLHTEAARLAGGGSSVQRDFEPLRVISESLVTATEALIDPTRSRGRRVAPR